MTSDFPVVLDACVLVPAALRDTLLRLAEKDLYLPRWSDEIIAEMARTLEQKRNKTREQTTHLVEQLRTYFGDAWVQNYEPIVSKCTNNEKDRHVLAVAIRTRADLIVTTNLKHFPVSAIAPWNIEVAHPDNFLVDMHHLNPELVVHTLHEQARDIGRTFEMQLEEMKKGLPRFVQVISEALRIMPSPADNGFREERGASTRIRRKPN